MEEPMKTRRLTMAQALIEFLKNQYVDRDEQERQFFAGCFGILGHGNVAGIGQALQQHPDFRYYHARNEQAMVHSAAAFAKKNNRLRAFACTASIGPGTTNMVTAAAGATINRLPVLLLPGDIFARRNVAPVLQQLESSQSDEVSVSDCLKPVSRYWDRINRPDQLPFALQDAMRVLTSPSDVGAVTLALPQDVQAEAWDYPAELFEKRVWTIPRARADSGQLRRAVEWIRAARRPLIVAGGGVLYSEASTALAAFAEGAGIPVAETHAGKGSLRWDNPQNLGGIGFTGSLAANRVAREADLVIAIGARMGDFATSSLTAFQDPQVRFIHINVAEIDAYKHAALPLVADARATLEELAGALGRYRVEEDYASRVSQLRDDWRAEVEEQVRPTKNLPITQAEVIGRVNRFARPGDVVVAAAGNLPGDLHKLWRTGDPGTFHLEYGYSCMGYETAAGLGVKMAAPDSEVYVMVGDGSYLLMSSEIVTSIQEGYRLNVVLLDNHGYGSIGALSRSVGSGGFGTSHRFRDADTGQLDGAVLPIDLAASAASLGAHAIRAVTVDDIDAALEQARLQDRTTVIVVEIDGQKGVPGYEGWWDLPVAEVSEMQPVRDARVSYDRAREKQRNFL
jgi:3D-(3,5/4)-trihydroxycyclohexane-1,2-dione acylhydrolase (decyclizing)